jgi:hypothetical protein
MEVLFMKILFLSLVLSAGAVDAMACDTGFFGNTYRQLSQPEYRVGACTTLIPAAAQGNRYFSNDCRIEILEECTSFSPVEVQRFISSPPVRVYGSEVIPYSGSIAPYSERVIHRSGSVVPYNGSIAPYSERVIPEQSRSVRPEVRPAPRPELPLPPPPKDELPPVPEQDAATIDNF